MKAFIGCMPLPSGSNRRDCSSRLSFLKTPKQKHVQDASEAAGGGEMASKSKWQKPVVIMTAGVIIYGVTIPVARFR